LKAEIQPKAQPESSLLITTTNQEDEKEKKKEGKNKRAFERFVGKAMEDGYWIKLFHMQTGLPVGQRTDVRFSPVL
ncbi:MAG: hypothetical protein LBU44_01470, partial [Mediterranea sp.]|nr:hypothetical protein [Mediterranea sp.]